MFTRSKLMEFAPCRFIATLFRSKRKRKFSSESPWLENLDDRLASYDQNLMQPTSYRTNESIEAEEQLRKLCNEVNEAQDPDRVVVRKERKLQDTTSVDMKAWWGGAVATWDPIDQKNLDSISQQPRVRKAKWFDNQPGSDLGRPR